MTYSGRFSADQKSTIPLSAISEFNVHISLFLRRLLLASGCLLSLNTSLWAQSNFIPLEKGDYKELEERPTYAPVLEVGGSYRLRNRWIDANPEPETPPGFPNAGTLSFEQDLRIFLRSTAHRAASIQLELATAQAPFNNADLRPPAERPNAPDSQDVDLVARQAYLEFRANPRDQLRVGKQELRLGDRRGKVFSGLLTGIAQQCTAGSFCYEAGALKLQDDTADWLYTLSLDYPLFYELDAAGQPENVMRVEVFRIIYTERNIPLGRNNAPGFRLSNGDLDRLRGTSFANTNSCSSELKRQAVVGGQDCTPVHFDATSQDYYGVRFTWNTPSWRWYSDLLGNQGNRAYYSLGANNDYGQSLGSYAVAGVATEHELSYLWDNHQVTGLFLYASGDEQLEDGGAIDNKGQNYQRSIRAFHEIVPGTYRGTNFYFNGGSPDWQSGTGLGHTIANTQMLGARYRFTVEGSETFYEAGFYSLEHVEPVMTTSGGKASHIGVEWDNTFSWKLRDFVTWDLELNFFRQGKAFRYDDYQPAEEGSDSVTHFASRVYYSF